MDTSSFNTFMDVIVLVAGLYLLYGWFRLVFQNVITPGLLIPKDMDPKSCKDLEGFKKYMGIRTLLIGVCAVGVGVLGLLSTYVFLTAMAVYWVCYFIFFGVIIYYMVASKNAQKKFF